MTKSKIEMIKQPLENISAEMKKSAWFSIIEAVLIIIFGIFLVANPGVTTLVLANVLGTIFIVTGLYQIINYFIVKGQRDFFNNGLLIGVVSLLIGIAMLVAGEGIAGVFRIIVGIWLVYESLVRINLAIKLQAAAVKNWGFVLAAALLMLALGLFVTFNAGAVMQLIGWMMITTGIIGIVGDAMFIRQVNVVVEKLTKTFKK